MEQNEAKNEKKVTSEVVENSKREDEDTTLNVQNNEASELKIAKNVSLGKHLLGGNALKKGISVSVRGRNTGSGVISKNGGSAWKKKDEKGNEDQAGEAEKKIDEESFPDLLESTEKIKSELSKEKDKKKKGGKEMKKNEESPIRLISEKGKIGSGSVGSEKKKLYLNNIDVSQNNESISKNWFDHMNENEVFDLKNKEFIGEKKEEEPTGYLMSGFKGKHMLGFYCFLKKGNQNPPPAPPSIPFDDTSFFDIIEGKNSLQKKPLILGVTVNQQITPSVGRNNHMMYSNQLNPNSNLNPNPNPNPNTNPNTNLNHNINHNPNSNPNLNTNTNTNPLINTANVNMVNTTNANNMDIGNNTNKNRINRMTKGNMQNNNDTIVRERQDKNYNRYTPNMSNTPNMLNMPNMPNQQVMGINTKNLNMHNERMDINSHVKTNNNNNNNNTGNRMNNLNTRNTRSIGHNNMSNNSIGSVNGGTSTRGRNFVRRNERRYDRKHKVVDIDADVNWRSPVNKNKDDEKKKK